MFLCLSSILLDPASGVQHLTKARAKRPPQSNRNRFQFERMECKVNADFVGEFRCIFKPLVHNTYYVDITLELIQEIREISVHFELYYRFATYRKFMIDIWEDMCGYLESHDSAKVRVMNLIFKNIHNLTNVHHACPYNGTVFIRSERYSFENFAFEPLLPSGRYRIDLNYTNDKRELSYVSVQTFVSVSDYRLWH